MRKETELTVHLLNQKLDRIERNHLPHVISRLDKLEHQCVDGIGLSTLGAVFAAALGIIFFPQS